MSFKPFTWEEIDRMRANAKRDDEPWQLSKADFVKLCDMAECSLSAPSPCGHPSQYAYSEDGGKIITCLLCERSARPEALRSGETPRTDALIASKPGLWREWKDSDFHELSQHAGQMERLAKRWQQIADQRAIEVADLKTSAVSPRGQLPSTVQPCEPHNIVACPHCELAARHP